MTSQVYEIMSICSIQTFIRVPRSLSCSAMTSSSHLMDETRFDLGDEEDIAVNLEKAGKPNQSNLSELPQRDQE